VLQHLVAAKLAASKGFTPTLAPDLRTHSPTTILRRCVMAEALALAPFAWPSCMISTWAEGRLFVMSPVMISPSNSAGLQGVGLKAVNAACSARGLACPRLLVAPVPRSLVGDSWSHPLIASAVVKKDPGLRTFLVEWRA